MLEVSGKTPDGKIVVRGVYRFYETMGLPLDVTLEYLRERKMIPDWPAFLLEAVEAGMSPERALSLLDSAISDSYGAATRDVVVSRLKRLMSTHEEAPPTPTRALRLLADEYARLYELVSKLSDNPPYEALMGAIEAVLGAEVVRQMQGHVVGFQIVEKLPEDRLVDL